MTSDHPIIVWFRNDLRIEDHPALHAASLAGQPVLPVYVLDEQYGKWAKGAASCWWLHHSLHSLGDSLRKMGSQLVLRRGCPATVLADIVASTEAERVYFSRHHERRERDLEAQVLRSLPGARSFAGNRLHEPGSILNGSGAPYRVFTPFFNATRSEPAPARPLGAPDALAAPKVWPRGDVLEDWALLPAKPDWSGGLGKAWQPGEAGAQRHLEEFLDEAVADYAHERDRPGLPGTSRLSPHLHFGEISVRRAWHAVSAHPQGDSSGARSWLRELGWREFCAHLLYHFPDLPDLPLQEKFTAFPWVRDDDALAAWQRGQTGYPIIDAGMRELWETGWMHNRVRMIAASFLIKDLRIDWRTGEDWFWDTLVDADLANNAAGWQWVAGSGADAAPFFRIFNPVTQARKFDPDGAYVRHWVPELAGVPDSHLHAPWTLSPLDREAVGLRLGKTYPEPIVDHQAARKAALAAFEEIRNHG